MVHKGLTCYLAGPMRSAENFGREAFARGAALLRKNGWEVTSPSEVDDTEGWPTTWCEAMARDIPLVIAAGRIVLLPGWEESPGTLVELLACLATGGHAHTIDLDTGLLERANAAEVRAAWHHTLPWEGLAGARYGRMPFDGRQDWKDGAAEERIERLSRARLASRLGLAAGEAVGGAGTLAVDELPLDDAQPAEAGHGGMDYDRMREIGAELADLVIEKSQAYGPSFDTSAEMLKLLYPDGIPVEKYGAMLALARVWDKMGRIATDEDAFGESPWRDIVGYGLRMVEQGERS